MRKLLVLLVALSWAAPFTSTSTAQVAPNDHLKCYKVQDPLRLKGPKEPWLLLHSEQFGPEKCKIVGAFRYFCAPVTKEVILPIRRKIKRLEKRFQDFQPNPFPGVPQKDLICYKIKCPKVDIRPTLVTDQFATRSIRKFKADILCGPAVKGDTVPICGNGVLDPGEQCDPGNPPAGVAPDDAACPGLCRRDCKCGPEIDYFPDTQASVDILLPTGGQMTVHLRGPTQVNVYLGELRHLNLHGTEMVPTEIVQMELVSDSPLGHVTMRAGRAFGLPSPGEIRETVNRTPGVLDIPPFAPQGTADSFFDVFVEVELPGGFVLHTVDPLRMEATITNKPPAPGETYGKDPAPVELFDEAGEPTGMFIGGGTHTPTPLECKDTSPQCDGACPPEQTCVSFLDPTGREGCVCRPSPTRRPCGSDIKFPECDGTCPPGQMCMDVQIDPDTPGECGCKDVISDCESRENQFGAPLCWGGCPEPSVCIDTGSAGCKCL